MDLYDIFNSCVEGSELHSEVNVLVKDYIGNTVFGKPKRKSTYLKYDYFIRLIKEPIIIKVSTQLLFIIIIYIGSIWEADVR